MTSQNIQVASYENKQYIWKQSAHALFNCMKELQYLKLALTNMGIAPRYYPEYVDYLKINNLNKIIFPMTCFCDIPLSKLNYHIDNYGSYAIGLDKANWGISNGLQPIKYVNPQSQLSKDYVSSFNIASNINLSEKDSVLKDYILSDLLFTKPLIGKMDKKDNVLFQDECEWRYVPPLSDKINIPLVLSQNQTQILNYNLELYNRVILEHPELWLRFTIEDIRYLIVPNESDSKLLLEFIFTQLDLCNSDKYVLATKIIQMDNLREDI